MGQLDIAAQPKTLPLDTITELFQTATLDTHALNRKGNATASVLILVITGDGDSSVYALGDTKYLVDTVQELSNTLQHIKSDFVKRKAA